MLELKADPRLLVLRDFAPLPVLRVPFPLPWNQTWPPGLPVPPALVLPLSDPPAYRVLRDELPCRHRYSQFLQFLIQMANH